MKFREFLDKIKENKESRLSPAQLVALGFLVVIAIGTALLMCPISRLDRTGAPFLDALFTAVSATCVTGLIVVDTAAAWSIFGRAVILLLIQIGGLGTMTIITAILVFIKKRVTLQESRLIMQSAGTIELGGMRVLLHRIFKGTFICEGVGALLLMTRMIPAFGPGTGILKSVFLSISAFCNAGFDTLGDYAGGSSLSAFSGDPVVNLTIMLLIITGGLGFIVWGDLVQNRFKLKKLMFHTKIVLTVTLVLIFGGAALFFVFEKHHAFEGFSLPKQIMASFFQSVTSRTAGFAGVGMSELSDSGSVLTMFLMIIGGSPGSTAGGMKTTTIAVIVLSAVASARKSNQPTAFGRALDEQTVRQAGSVAAIYVMASVFAVMILCAVEEHSLRDIAFEVVSAIGTVGLSTGITPTLGTAARIVLTFYMYAGRIGGLTVALLLSERHGQPPTSKPVGKLLVG